MSQGTYNLLYGFTTLVGTILVALTLTWVIKYQDGFAWSSDIAKQFNWHPFLMVLGLVFLYSQSILVYRSGRYFITKKNLKYIHGCIHLLAFILSIIALQAVFNNHNKNGYANLYSIHSWIGILTVIIFAAQFLGGFITFLFPGLPGHLRKAILPMHVFLGTLAFIMAIVTTLAGITEMALWTDGYSDLPPVAYTLNFMGLFAVLYGGLTLYLLLTPDFKRIPLPED